jgi:CRP/FNR family transcriptional regulator, cyclic AMP receptor protein
MPPSFSVDTLLKVPLCQGLSPAEAKAIFDIAEDRQVKAGEPVFSEGETGDALYFILSGQVDIEKKDKSGKPAPLARLSDGAVVGEMSLIAGSAKRSASAKAAAETRLLRIPSDRFQKLLKSDHVAALKVVRNMAQVMSRRLLAMDEKIVELLGKDGGSKKSSEFGSFQKLLNDWSF